MDIHVVQPGDTLSSIAREFEVPLEQLILDNQLSDPTRLVVGQTIVVQYPDRIYFTQENETLALIALRENIPVRQLLRNNPGMSSRTPLPPGQRVVLSFRQKQAPPIAVNGYAFPSINERLLQDALPYLTYLCPFTLEFTASGELSSMYADPLIAQAQAMGVKPFLRVSSFPEPGSVENTILNSLLESSLASQRLIREIVAQVHKLEYQGVDLDFQGVTPDHSQNFVDFVFNLREALADYGLPVNVSVPPKTGSDLSERLYAGYDYQQLGKAATYILLSTYQWGFATGPPIAVSPLPNVQKAVEYAVTQIRPGQIMLGIPNYGYDWKIPFQPGQRAAPLSNPGAVDLARDHYVAIQYNTRYQSPWMRYVDEEGQEHEVWFEDARSIQAKLALISQYHLLGVSYWTLMRPFPQNWRVLNAMYGILGDK